MVEELHYGIYMILHIKLEPPMPHRLMDSMKV